MNGDGDGSADRFEAFAPSTGPKPDERGRATVCNSADEVLDTRTH